MTHDIVSLPSGFYGLEVITTGEIVNASLVKWDGQRGTAYKYNTNGQFEYYQDAHNTVYYTDAGGKNARVWCAGSRLNSHCHRLQQIAARR